MKTIKENINIIVGVSFFIVAMFIYSMFFKTEDTIIPDETIASGIGEDLIRMHTELERVNFDQSLFSSPIYQGLIDFTVPIPQQPTGRPNPFDAIGRD